MFSSLRRLVGAIKITESGDLIKIDGLPADVIMRDIKSYWDTKKIETWMFASISTSSLSFHKFFLPDFAYVISVLINQRAPWMHRRALRKLYELLYEQTSLKLTLQDHPNILNFAKLSELNVTMKPHQMTFLSLYNDKVPKYQLNGFLMGAAPGTGKTLMSLALGLCLEADVVIGVVPKNAVEKVWADTIKERFNKKQLYWTSLSGEELKPGYKYYFFHYESLEKAVQFFSVHRPRKAMIVLDESHNLNELESLRTQFFIKLCDVTQCKHVIWSSGTLLKAMGTEMMPMLRTIIPSFNNDVVMAFKKIYGRNARRAVDIIRNRMGLISFQVNKDAIMDTKPSFHVEKIKMANSKDYELDTIKVAMKEFILKQLAYYKNNMKDFRRRYDYLLTVFVKTLKTSEQWNEFKHYQKCVEQISKAYDPVTMKEIALFCNGYEKKVIIPNLPSKEMREEMKGLRSIVKYYTLKVQGEALGRILGPRRMQCNVDMVKHMPLAKIIDEAEKKTIMFTSYVEVIHEADKILRAQGYKPLMVYAETNSEIVQIVNSFGKDIDANPLIATYKSLSAAVPLVMANTLILGNSPFRSYEEEQAVSRAHRLGQDTHVNVFRMLLDTGDIPNVSTRANDILEWSRLQVAEIMGIPVQGQMGMNVESFMDFIEGPDTLTEHIDVVAPVWDQWREWSDV